MRSDRGFECRGEIVRRKGVYINNKVSPIRNQKKNLPFQKGNKTEDVYRITNITGAIHEKKASTIFDFGF